MRSNQLIHLALAAGAFAGPLMKRGGYDDVVTVDQTEVQYVTKTEYVDAAGPTSEPQAPVPAPGPGPNDNVVVKVVTIPGDGNAPVDNGPAPAPPPPGPGPEYQAPAPGPPPPAPGPPPPAPAPGPSLAQAPSAAPYVPPSGVRIVPQDSQYQNICLYHHNIHRANHSAPDLTWSDDMASRAIAQVETCSMNHVMDTNGGGYGQNLAAQGPSLNLAGGISDGWYNGEAYLYADYFGQPNPSGGNLLDFGHFTQMVWKSSTQVGCATKDCTGTALGMWLTACNYLSEGNMGGEYGDNVLRAVGQPSCSGNEGPH